MNVFPHRSDGENTLLLFAWLFLLIITATLSPSIAVAQLALWAVVMVFA